MMHDLLKSNASKSIFHRFLCFSSQIIVVLFLLENIFCVADQPQLSTHRRDEQQRLTPKHKFSYHVRNIDPIGGGQYGHHFYRNGQNIEGKYYVKLNEGAAQNVEYYTDQFGYHPKVVYTNNGETGTSGARMTFGAEAYSFEHPPPSRDDALVEDIANEVSTDPTTSADTSTFTSTPLPTEPTPVYRAKIPDILQHTKIIFSTPDKVENASFPPEPNSDGYILPEGVPAYGNPLLVAHPTISENLINPEINEISNGFVDKIVSVMPGMFAPSKLIRPIIVSNNSTRKIDSTNGTDQSIDPQLLEYANIATEEDEGFLRESHPVYKPNDTTNDDSKKSSESGVEVLIEPQMVEEQAVITTTLDIAKSLPLTFIPEVDNNIQESAPNVPTMDVNLPLPIPLPQVQFLSHPNTFPPSPIMTDPRPVINMPYPGFHYIPLPVLQHQPNIIPLSYMNDVRNVIGASPPGEESNLTRILLDLSGPKENSRPKDFPASFPSHEFPDRKQVKYRSIASFGQQVPQQNLFFRRPLLASSHATSVSPANLIPYVKQITSSPSFLHSHPYTQYLARQRTGSGDLPLISPQSMAYNIKYFPKDQIGKLAMTHQQKSSAPFKPSHPVWDSIYPPSHMYYVPYYVMDKPPADRKARDSFSKNRRYLRRLYVEYGGFKPPLIPSTLLDVDGSTKKSEVPKETAESV